MQMIQGLILDISYTNEQIQRFACLGAIFIQRDLKFPQTYTVDIVSNLIDPIPTNNDFCLFVAMYAALLIVKNEIREASTSSVRISDVPSSIDITTRTKNLIDYYNLLQADYDKAKIAFLRSGKLGNIGLVVTTPI